MAETPKPMRTRPETRLIQRTAPGVTRARARLTPPESTSHQSAEPVKTAATKLAALA